MTANHGSVLIVDDEESICGILSRLIATEGLKPLVANDGQAALKMIGLNTIDVLLIDFKMPGMDGIKLIKRAQELSPDLLAVLITAYGDDDVHKETMKLNRCAYLEKPFTPNTLLKVIKDIVERN